MDLDMYPIQSLITPLQLGIIGRLRRLWIEVSVWMRDLAIATIRDPERESATAAQLFTGVINEFYQIFSTYYDPDIAQQVVNLLYRIFTSIWELIRAVKENNQEAVNESTRQLYQRANDLSNYLAQINFFWGAEQWQNLLYQYIRLKIVQIISIARGDFERETGLYRELENIAVLMGNYMAGGFIAGTQMVPQTQNPQTAEQSNSI